MHEVCLIGSDFHDGDGDGDVYLLGVGEVGDGVLGLRWKNVRIEIRSVREMDCDLLNLIV